MSPFADAAVPVLTAPMVGEDQRIVGGAVEFHFGHGARLGEGIANGAVNLWSAAQAVGVLDARVFGVRTVGLTNLAAFVEARQIFGGDGGAGICARLHDARIECAGAAAQRVQRKSCGDVSGIHKSIGFQEREAQKREHSLRAIQQREAFFGFESYRRDSGALQRGGAIQNFSVVIGAAFANHHLGEVGQWREIAGSSHGTLRGNQRVNFGVEHFAKSVDYVRANAAEAFGESVGAEQHHGAGFAFAERFANAAGMGAHEIYLQLCNLFRGDAHGSEFAEAGVDAVGGRAGGYEFVHHRARGFHALDGGGWRETDSCCSATARSCSKERSLPVRITLMELLRLCS